MKRQAKRAHEHFCKWCFPKHGGWYRCVDAKCVQEPEAVCKRHHEAEKRAIERVRNARFQ